jgi:hypothetical protein
MATKTIEKKAEVEIKPKAIVEIKPEIEDAGAIDEDISPIEEELDVKSVLSDIIESVDFLSDNTEVFSKTVVKKHKLDLADKIPCKSLFHGKLIYTSPTNGSRYIWNEYGVVRHIPLGELETMNNHKPDFLNKPLILILESEVVEAFNLENIYQKVGYFNKLNGYFEKGEINLIKEKVQELIDVGMRETVIADIRKRRKENTLVDINIINMLKSELKCNIE